jgi:hypothetical protein
MNIISFVKDESVNLKINEVVTSKLDIGIVTVRFVEDCLGLFEILDDIAAIIFDEHFSEAVIEMVKSNELGVDLLYIGTETLSDGEFNLHCFKDVESILPFISSNISHPKSRFNVIDDKELYYPIISSTLIKMAKTPVDIYMRLKKDDYFHYIKFINKGDELEQGQIEKLESIPRVFVKRGDKAAFFDDMNKVLLALLRKTSNPKTAQTENDVRLEIFNQLISIGLSEKSTEIATATIENVTESLSKGLLKEIKSVYSSDAPDNYRKSFLASILCVSIAKKLSWVTPSNVEALVLVSFFNDRLLTRDSMHFVEPGNSLDISDYTIDEKELFLNHARLTADWMAKQKSMPPEAERIVRQHHGSVNGVGLETNLSAQITKLTMLFIVAEEFAMEILVNHDQKLNVKTCLKNMNARYNNHNVKQIIEALFLALKN